MSKRTSDALYDITHTGMKWIAWWARGAVDRYELQKLIEKHMEAAHAAGRREMREEAAGAVALFLLTDKYAWKGNIPGLIRALLDTPEEPAK